MSESAVVITTTAASILTVVNIMGNSLVCAIVKKNRNMRYVENKTIFMQYYNLLVLVYGTATSYLAAVFCLSCFVFVLFFFMFVFLFPLGEVRTWSSSLPWSFENWRLPVREVNTFGSLLLSYRVLQTYRVYWPVNLIKYRQI